MLLGSSLAKGAPKAVFRTFGETPERAKMRQVTQGGGGGGGDDDREETMQATAG